MVRVLPVLLSLGLLATSSPAEALPGAKRVPASAALSAEARTLLETQAAAWNRGDLEAFMQAYERTDSLRFVTRAGLLLGYDSLYARYRRTYQADGQMGTLHFDLLRVDVLDARTALVIGRWRVADVPRPGQGHFTLLLRRRSGRWQIALDHTS